MNEHANIIVRGAVQGVGFRPFVFRLATELNLCGFVLNSSQGVVIEIEGERRLLEEFVARLETEKPGHSIIQSMDVSFHPANGYEGFEILESKELGAKSVLILPDLATCPDCVREIFDPCNRRHLYPFTNCTNCGPRFSIVGSLPYDRANTSMKAFTMCEDCEHEYHNLHDRRFHAQPNACPKCGPQLEFLENGVSSFQPDSCTLEICLHKAADAIRAGKILALKGIGGFQLLVDARSETAVRRLRERKQRAEKPFAVMYPDIDAVKADCIVSELEEELLRSSEAPIVLLEKLIGEKFIRADVKQISPSVAPNNPSLGVMLPYSPLHHILLRELGFPVVATSGNLSDEPICIDEREALERLCDIADVFLIHNRPIVRPVDDSVVRVMLDREMILRRARGYAPLPISISTENDKNFKSVLAVGAHLKNSIALSVGNQVFISQHIGDLETLQALDVFRKVAKDLPRLYEVKPDIVACDLHPEYLSTKHAKISGARIVEVQHHFAHVASCMAENRIKGPTLGIAWDGTGFGLDGTIWGGEFLAVETSRRDVPAYEVGRKITPLNAVRTEQPTIPENEHLFVRFAHFRNFRLPGGEAAIKQPRRVALGLLWEIFGKTIFERHEILPLKSFSTDELAVLRQMLAGKINSPLTSSAGRLFDAVASIIGLRQRVSFEGQAAVDLEFACRGIETQDTYNFSILPHEERLIIDWQPMILEILHDFQNARSVGLIAARFHNTLAEIIVAIARRAGISQVVLTGGCFQNKVLTELAVNHLRADGFEVFWHRHVPLNDGGIAFGQAVAALWQLREEAELRSENCKTTFAPELKGKPSLEPVH
jgi:hydrogenase maturation protein HypF